VRFFHSIAILPIAFVCSCSNDGGSSTSEADSGFKPFSQRMADNLSGRNGGFVKDDEGNWKSSSGKRSSFETNRESAYFKGDVQKKEYGGKKDYSKKSWWGDTRYESKTYEGNTDGSRFQTVSRHQGTGARESGSAADLPEAYQTGNYATGAARETGKRNISKPSDAETDVRRRVYPKPTVTNWGEERRMSMEDTKSFLGR
jgi:hypothetical protein